MYGGKTTNPQKTPETENYHIKPNFKFELKDANVDLTPVRAPDEIGSPVLHPTHYNQGKHRTIGEW